MSVEEAWNSLAATLVAAGDRLARDTEALDPTERADGYRSLLRALNHQLGRFEVDREHPELVESNGWREKFFMDNPDVRYWVADVRDDRRYRIVGDMGDAVYASVTAYRASGAEVTAQARIDSDEWSVDPTGAFELTLSAEPPEQGDWLPLPPGTRAVWVRLFHDDVRHDRPGACRIEPLDPTRESAPVDPEQLGRHLDRLAATMDLVPAVMHAATAEDLRRPNELRHWNEMQGGAAYTEPGIHYVRGAWQLEPGEALVIQGDAVPSRFWNVLLYSRFLNSLDHRTRQVSRTGATARVVEGRYRFVLAARDPRADGDWLDTEGRRCGLVVMRWLHPETTPELPRVRRCRIDELDAEPDTGSPA